MIAESIADNTRVDENPILLPGKGNAVLVTGAVGLISGTVYFAIVSIV